MAEKWQIWQSPQSRLLCCVRDVPPGRSSRENVYTRIYYVLCVRHSRNPRKDDHFPPVAQRAPNQFYPPPPRRFMCIKLCSARRINFFVSGTHMHISQLLAREKHRGASHGEFNHDLRATMPSPIMVLFSCDASAQQWCDLVAQSVRELLPHIDYIAIPAACARGNSTPVTIKLPLTVNLMNLLTSYSNN